MILIRRVERSLHCTLPVLRHRFQPFLRVFQLHLRLFQFQSGMGAFDFSHFLLPECFLCLCTRFEELRAQTLDKHGGFLEQRFPVLESPRQQSAAAEEKIFA